MTLFFTPPGIYIVLVIIILVSLIIYQKRKWFWKEFKKLRVTEIAIGPVKLGLKEDGPPKNSKEGKTASLSKSNIQSKLPGKLYTRFIGRNDEIESIINVLTNPRGKRLVGIYGIGGVGKSALAREVSEKLLAEGIFTSAWWTTAKRTSLDVIDELSPDKIVSYDTILSRLTSWLGLASELRGIRDLSQRIKRVQNELTTTPILLILDNLETAADQNYIALQIATLLAGTPSRAVMTSREAWDNSVSLIERVQLHGLSTPDALQFLRFIARENNNHRVMAATDEQLRSAAEAVGYLPLALKLAVGLMQYSDLTNVLEDLEKIQSQKTTQLYDYLFSNSWRRLNQEEKELLIVLSQFDEEEGISAALLSTSQVFPEGSFGSVIRELADHSLLEISGGIDDTRYTLHPLTLNFIRSQTIR